MTSVALAHDYLTQRGGAERVVLAMVRAFPGATLHTTLYEPTTTFPEFVDASIETSPLNRLPVLRHHHRLSLPLLAPVVSRMRIDADVAVCSSSGWAHGMPVSGRKVVYCHNPPRWLYQTDEYLVGRWSRRMLSPIRPLLRGWDRRAAATADRYLANSRAVQARIRSVYGIDAELLPPPHGARPGGRQDPVGGLEPGFLLCVSRLMPYKNVDAVVDAVTSDRGFQLVVVGTGPHEGRLRERARPNGRIVFVGAVTDAQLRWLYANSVGLIAASYEDFGLTPLEVGAFGKPVAALRWGGFLDTVLDGETGVFFDVPEPGLIRDAVRRMLRQGFDEAAIRGHADRFSEPRFIARLREIAAAELGQAEQR